MEIPSHTNQLHWRKQRILSFFIILYFILFYFMLGQIFHLFFSSFLIDVFLFLLEEIVELCL